MSGELRTLGSVPGTGSRSAAPAHPPAPTVPRRAGTQAVFRHGYTYSGHPTACAVGLANLDVLEREQLIQRVRELEPVLADALHPLAAHPLVGEVRVGAGLLAAVEIADEARAANPALGAHLVGAIRQRGVITRLLRGTALQVSPPFVITKQELGRIAEVFSEALDSIDTP